MRRRIGVAGCWFVLSVCLALGQSDAAQSGPTDALLTQARTAVQAGSFSSADAMVRKYLSQQDASADGHYLLGYILSHEGKARESLAEYTRAAQLRPPTANDLKWLRWTMCFWATSWTRTDG